MQNGERKIGSGEQTVNQQRLVKFNVENESGLPLKNVEVLVNASGTPETEWSDNNGYVTLNIPSEGDVRITLKKEGYEAQTITVNLNNRQSINRRYRLREINQNQSDKVPVDNKSIDILLGIWEQYSSNTMYGNYQKIGEFLVTKKNGAYIMAVKEQNNPSIKTLSISEVMYDGNNWTFNSRLQNGFLINFELKKISDNRFEGRAIANGQIIQKDIWKKIE
jgi:hypothetical protein